MIFSKTLATSLITGALLSPIPAQAAETTTVISTPIHVAQNNTKTSSDAPSTTKNTRRRNTLESYGQEQHWEVMSVLQKTSTGQSYQFFKNDSRQLISLYSFDDRILEINESTPVGKAWHNTHREHGLGLPIKNATQDSRGFAEQHFQHGIIRYSPLTGISIERN